METILIVGGADTGRAPMAAALLARLLAARAPGCRVGSAGVLGHDDDPAETEARDTMVHMGLDISDHRARSVGDALVEGAALVVGIDSGTTRVLLGRFPGAAARIAALGDLAGRPRDIPDPFRMQIGAWLSYARELEQMLTAALPQILQRLPAELREPAAEPAAAEPARGAGLERAEALGRLERLLWVAADMPAAIDWGAARGLADAEIGRACQPDGPADLAPAYAGLLRAALALSAAPPTPGQLRALRAALEPLGRPLAQDDLTRLSVQLGGWASLT